MSGLSAFAVLLVGLALGATASPSIGTEKKEDLLVLRPPPPPEEARIAPTASQQDSLPQERVVQYYGYVFVPSSIEENAQTVNQIQTEGILLPEYLKEGSETFASDKVQEAQTEGPQVALRNLRKTKVEVGIDGKVRTKRTLCSVCGGGGGGGYYRPVYRPVVRPSCSSGCGGGYGGGYGGYGGGYGGYGGGYGGGGYGGGCNTCGYGKK